LKANHNSSQSPTIPTCAVSNGSKILI